MRTEIGSEFWNVPITRINNHLFDNVSWFVSGRSALRAILKSIKKDKTYIKVALPSYLCDSMIEPFEKEKIDYFFYNVEYINEKIVSDYSNIKDCNVILVLDYFGYDYQSGDIPSNMIIIRDLTHSLFLNKKEDADYYFGSLRKWAGFYTGGFAYSKKEIIRPKFNLINYIQLRKKAMRFKKKYIENYSESKNYLDVFYKAEEKLDKCIIGKSNKKDIINSLYLDIDYLKQKRRENAQFLINELKDYCMFKELKENDCPLCVPIIYKKRDELRKILINNEVYCPIHWPKPCKIINDYSNFLYNYELSIVCDQRYSLEDMKKIVNLVKEFMEKNND